MAPKLTCEKIIKNNTFWKHIEDITDYTETSINFTERFNRSMSIRKYNQNNFKKAVYKVL